MRKLVGEQQQTTVILPFLVTLPIDNVVGLHPDRLFPMAL